MPTIGDLGGVRQCLRNRFAIGAAAVSRDDLDLWAQRQPGLRRGALAIGQQRDDPPSLEVADDRAISVIAPIRPVVDANDAQGLWRALSFAALQRAARCPC